MKSLFKSIVLVSIIGLNPVLFAMDETFQCKVGLNPVAPIQSAMSEQEHKKSQASLDAIQFAKEKEAKMKSALQNALCSSEKPDFQLCKTTLLFKRKLPDQLKRYTCSYLDKQFYLTKSFKAHNGPFCSVMTHTKPDGSWYILAVTLDGVAVKIDGATDEVEHVFDKFPEIIAIATHAQPNGTWSIIIGTRLGQIAVYDGDECNLTKTMQNHVPVVGGGPYPVSHLSTGAMDNGDWYIFATTKFDGSQVIGWGFYHRAWGLFNTFSGSDIADPNFANNTYPAIGYIENNIFRSANIRFPGGDGVMYDDYQGRALSFYHKDQDKVYPACYYFDDGMLRDIITTHIYNNKLYLLVKTGQGKIIIINAYKFMKTAELDFALSRIQGLQGLEECSIATYNKGGDWYIALRTSDHKIRIFNGLTGKLEKIVSDTTNDLICPLPIAVHVQPKGNIDLVVTHENGNISIISEGPGVFEQGAMQSCAQSLELPMPLNVKQPNGDKRVVGNDNNNNNKWNQFIKISVAGVVASTAVALLRYLKK